MPHSALVLIPRDSAARRVGPNLSQNWGSPMWGQLGVLVKRPHRRKELRWPGTAGGCQGGGERDTGRGQPRPEEGWVWRDGHTGDSGVYTQAPGRHLPPETWCPLHLHLWAGRQQVRWAVTAMGTGPSKRLAPDVRPVSLFLFCHCCCWL